MQTFIPLSDYHESMWCLHPRWHLGNQVWREGLTLIRGGWPHHPASKMWRGHEYHLGLYLLAGVDVLRERTQKTYDAIREKIITEMKRFSDTGVPEWFGNESLYASHRSNLLRKYPDWYSQFGWTEPNNLPYVWPV